MNSIIIQNLLFLVPFFLIASGYVSLIIKGATVFNYGWYLIVIGVFGLLLSTMMGMSLMLHVYIGDEDLFDDEYYLIV